jgi:aspartate/methionine/tyrosine aminotransferase
MEEKNMAQTLKLFPKDAIKRAQSYFENGMVSSGSYTISQGMTFIRGHVAQFIERRDGFPSDPNKIFLTNGASQAVTFVLQLLISGLDVGIMIPTPQYPLYSATLTLLNGVSCPYYLDEDDDWSISINELRRSIQQARQGGTNVRALVVINPGNPVGNCISVARMEEIVDFCVAENLVLLADEVYQENTYNSALPFASFKRVKERMGGRHRDLELFSFHSTSKGFFGECGKRGGYVELSGIDPEVEKQLLKLASIGLCSSVAGQITTDLMVDPPAPGEESYELFVQEKQSIIDSLKRRARRLVEVFNSLEAVTCNPAQGALYTFPQVRLSKKAIAEAERRGMTPDAFYCLQLLENTGVVSALQSCYC